MTPQKKAKELVNRYINLYPHPTEQYLDTDEAKLCALIAIDEIQNTKSVYVNDTEYDYWQQVKQEIEKL